MSPCPQICAQVGENGRRTTVPRSPPGGDDVAGGQGTGGGNRAATVHRGRVVHVSTQADGHRPTADQQGRSPVDLRGRVRSPGSTPVMKKMKEFSPGVLEPHSGWGRVGALVP